MHDGIFDPGHGGRDPGAIGKNGTREADINLIMAKKVAALLLPVMNIEFTRSTDISLGNTLSSDLAARVKKANQSNSDIFVSFHCNSSTSASAHGAEIYTTKGDTGADALATCVINRMEADLPELTFRKDLSDGDPDKEAGFYVLKNTRMPAVLIELAFISNPREEALLNSLEFQDRAALSIAKGICDFFGITLPKQTPSDTVTVVSNGKKIQGKLIGNETWVPLRPVVESLGHALEVNWGDTNNTVLIKTSADGFR